MGSESVEGLPEELRSWVEERAAAENASRTEIVRRLLAAHRLLEEDVDLEDHLSGLDDRISDLEDDLDEKITDVRKRVIQVKREADAKAPKDHDHPELEERIEAGFENYEEILEYLTDVTDEHDGKLNTAAGAIVDLRERVSALERESTERAAATELRREANRQGVTTAVCGSCGESVRLGLLDRPYCPHCESTFDGLDPKRGFFGSDELTVGQRPALEPAPTAADEADEATDGTALFDERGEQSDGSDGSERPNEEASES